MLNYSYIDIYQMGEIHTMEATWLEVILNVPSNQLDDLSGQLILAGVPGLVVENETEFLTFLQENRQYWDYVDDELLEHMKGISRIKFYITDDTQGKKDLERYLTDISLPYETIPLRENDWAHSWQKYYHPLAIGTRLYVVPEWEREVEIPSGRTPLFLNPGLTFGTGSHASTQLCLEAIEKYTEPGGIILDLGCGSGILSIAALRLGAARAIGMDIDAKAINVAYENAALNNIGRDRYLVCAGDVLSDANLLSELAREKYQLVLANIVADVIIPLATPAKTLLAAGGFFICSGIIDSRADEVATALETANYTILEKKVKNGWVSFVATPT
ncbi:MAG: 50S ribosomal protein L11 methyltransferase [Evtepia sp.]